MISLKELNPHGYPTTIEIDSNLSILFDRMNRVRTAYNKPMVITSGLRSQADQMRINPSAPKSKHMIGAACDVEDADGSLWDWIVQNLEMMKELGLYFEHPNWTHHPNKSGWCHFQVQPPASHKRVFVPSPGPALNPAFWTGTYASSLDV